MTASLPIVLPLTAPLVHGGYAPMLSGRGGGVPANVIISKLDSQPLRSKLDGARIVTRAF